MNRSKYFQIAIAIVSMGFISTAYALDDGWYGYSDTIGSCPAANSAVLFLEKDKAISISATGGSTTVEGSPKIATTPSRITAREGSEYLIGTIWKDKSNKIHLKVKEGSACVGAEIIFSKS